MPSNGPTSTCAASRIAVFLAGTVLAAAPAGAQDWSGLIGYSSDNILHGRSLGDGQSTWIGDLRLDRGGWSIGLGATSERPPSQSRGAQLTAHVDRRWRLGDDWSARLGLVHYESPWNTFNDELRYNEVSAAIGYRGRWHLVLTHAPDLPVWGNENRYLRGAATYLEAGLKQPLVGRLSAEFGLGHADLGRSDLPDYAYANAGLRYGIGPVYLYLAWHRANPPAQRYRERPGPATRWVGAIVWTF